MQISTRKFIINLLYCLILIVSSGSPNVTNSKIVIFSILISMHKSNHNKWNLRMSPITQYKVWKRTNYSEQNKTSTMLSHSHPRINVHAWLQYRHTKSAGSKTGPTLSVWKLHFHRLCLQRRPVQGTICWSTLLVSSPKNTVRLKSNHQIKPNRYKHRAGWILAFRTNVKT